MKLPMSMSVVFFKTLVRGSVQLNCRKKELSQRKATDVQLGLSTLRTKRGEEEEKSLEDSHAVFLTASAIVNGIQNFHFIIFPM